MDIFNSPQRKRLFQSMKMGWYNFCPIEFVTGIPLTDQETPYALYYCRQVSPQTIQEIKQASEFVGSVLMQAWSIIRALDEETLLYYGFTFLHLRGTCFKPGNPSNAVPCLSAVQNPKYYELCFGNRWRWKQDYLCPHG